MWLETQSCRTCTYVELSKDLTLGFTTLRVCIRSFIFLVRLFFDWSDKYPASWMALKPKMATYVDKYYIMYIYHCCVCQKPFRLKICLMSQIKGQPGKNPGLRVRRPPFLSWFCPFNALCATRFARKHEALLAHLFVVGPLDIRCSSFKLAWTYV